MFKALLISLTIVISASAPAIAQDKWERLATQNIDLSKGRTVIRFSPRKGPYKSIRLVPRRGRLVASRIVVSFLRGKKKIVARRVVLRPGRRPFVIGFANSGRRISRVVIIYSKRPGARRKTIIEVWGDRVPAPGRALSTSQLKKGRQLLQKGQHRQAQSQFSKALKKDPANKAVIKKAIQNAYIKKFKTLVKKSKRDGTYNTALGSKYSKTIRYSRKKGANTKTMVKNLSEAYVERGRSLLKAGKPKEARKSFNIAVDLDPSQQAAVNKSYRRMGRGKAKNGGGPTSNVCKARNICTPVPVFFGTERKRQELATKVTFTADRAGKLQLGRAIITVPKAADRKRGEIPRPGFWDWIWGVPVGGDPARHFTIVKNGFRIFSSAEDFIAEVRAHMKDAGDYKEHAFVFVHGFNVKFDAALYRTAQIAYDLGYDAQGRHIPFGTAFLYSWPSGGKTFDYAYDLESARLTIDHFKAFLELVATQSGAKQIHLIAHSMGNVPLMNALAEFAENPPKTDAKINQVVLAAPDMDVKEFEKLARSITPFAKSVTLYASSRDVAMKASRKVHRDKPRAGDVGDTGPIIVNKVYSIDISALSTAIFSIRHSEYAENRELLSDMNRLFVKQEQPPHIRDNNFQRRFRGTGEYWRYAP